MKSLQSLRFIFALMIFLHHVPGADGLGLFYAGGPLSVSFFFVLSGFVLTMAYKRKIKMGGGKNINVSSFAIKRLCRIYPLHLLCLLLFIIINCSTISLHELIKLVPNIFLMQSWIPDMTYYFSGNALSWFLSDLLFFYMIFPIIIGALHSNAIDNKTIVIFALFFVILYGLVIVFLKKDLTHPLLYINPFFRLFDFIIGIFLFFLHKFTARKFATHLMRLSRISKTLIETGIIALCVIMIIFIKHMPSRIVYASYWWIIVSLIIYTISLFDIFDGGMFTRVLRSNILVQLGNCSFCFYLIHTLVIQLVENFIDNGWIVRLVVALLFTIAFASILHRWFEKPVTSYLIRKYETKRF